MHSSCQKPGRQKPKCSHSSMNMRTFCLCGRSQTTFTRFWIFLTTYPLCCVDIFYAINKKWTFLEHLPTSSCKSSLWTGPCLNMALKFRFFEKATKIWRNLPFVLTLLSKRQKMLKISSNLVALSQYLNSLDQRSIWVLELFVRKIGDIVIFFSSFTSNFA